jgi:hypothetical protein
MENNEKLLHRIFNWTREPPFAEGDVDGNVNPTPLAIRNAMAMLWHLEPDEDFSVFPMGSGDITFESCYSTNKDYFICYDVENNGEVFRTLFRKNEEGDWKVALHREKLDCFPKVSVL